MIVLSNLILLFVSFAFISSSNAEDVCVQRSPCICVFSNGTGINLSPTAASSFYGADGFNNYNDSKQYRLSTYYYHPCTDLIPSVNTSTPSTKTCNQNLMLYRESVTFTATTSPAYSRGEEMCEYLGSSNTSTFSQDALSIYIKNGPSGNTILLVCSEGVDRLHVYSLDNPDNNVLAFYSKHACLKQIDEPGRSFGSTLLIVFFSMAIFYLVLGVCTKKFLMGATGLEVIPNLGFWSDLPNLVKDGWAFAANGFKLPARSGQMSSPDPNSYDSI